MTTNTLTIRVRLAFITTLLIQTVMHHQQCMITLKDKARSTVEASTANQSYDLQGTKVPVSEVPRSEYSWEQKFLGMQVRRPIRSGKWMFQGVKVRGNESSMERIDQVLLAL